MWPNVEPFVQFAAPIIDVSGAPGKNGAALHLRLQRGIIKLWIQRGRQALQRGNRVPNDVRLIHRCQPLAPLNRLWAKFGLLLHHVISPVFLGILFYVCITPIGFLMRLTGKDPMRRRFEPEAKSYWIVREPPGPAPSA